MRRLAPLFAFLVVAAGCITPANDVEPLAGKRAHEILPHLEMSEDHDHSDRASHDIAWNMELLGWDPIAESVLDLGRYNHVDLHGTRAFVSAYHLSKDAPPGLAILNISDADPRLVATLETPDMTPIDVHVSKDGKYAVLAGHRENRAALPAQIATACTGTPMLNLCAPFIPAGVILLDVADEATPRIVATWTSPPSGAHTAKVVAYADAHYVFIASYGFSYANRVASHVEILRVDDTPLGTRLVPVAEFFPTRPSGNDGTTSTFVHDMFIEEHPITRQTLMWVAYWDGGVVIADVTDPTEPREIAAWRDYDAALYGNIHFARPVGMIGERHISYAAPEFSSADHSGEAYILDTTDPAAPTLLTKWVLPGDPINDGSYRFSPHNFHPRGTKLVYAHYHGGVWVLDLAQPEAPIVEGYVFPVVPIAEPAFENADAAPNVWAAVWADDGTIWASDTGTGLYHYRLVSPTPGDPPYEAVLTR